ncbi:unnamed protein product [Urochloa humidicola]
MSTLPKPARTTTTAGRQPCIVLVTTTSTASKDVHHGWGITTRPIRSRRSPSVAGSKASPSITKMRSLPAGEVVEAAAFNVRGCRGKAVGWRRLRTR